MKKCLLWGTGEVEITMKQAIFGAQGIVLSAYRAITAWNDN